MWERDVVPVIKVRLAEAEDDGVLAGLEAATWSVDVSPASRPRGTAFFDERRRPPDVLVAEVDRAVVGYVHLGQSIPIPSHWHVLDVKGLAVDPAWRRRGVGRRLLQEAAEVARRRGARKLSLRVLEPNAAARGLYHACGFVVEGVLREEFLLAGQYVDDILMARQLHQ